MNFFRTLLNCCAGFRYYRSLLPLHPLQSVKFLAIVVLLIVVAQIGTFVPVLRHALDRGAEWVQYNLPRFEIRDGRARYEAELPFTFTNQFATITIDTSGNTNRPPYARPYALFIGQDKIWFGMAPPNARGELGPPRESVESLQGYPNGIVNGDYIRNLASPWLWRAAPYAVLIYFFAWLLAVLIQAYIFTLVISFAESATLRKFGFNEFFNIAAHACAPAAIVVTTLMASRMFRVEWLLMAFLGTYFIYVMGATAACRHDGEEEKTGDRDEMF